MITLEETVINKPLTTDAQESQTLSCGEMVCDGAKAAKAACDPVSDIVACMAGTLCCIATAAVQVEENKKPATRGDVLYANQRRKNDATEQNSAFCIGACIGDVCVDSSAIMLGTVFGCCRASLLSIIGNNQRENNVFGFSRQRIDEVNLFTSCGNEPESEPAPAPEQMSMSR